MGSCLLAAEAQATTVFSSRSLSKKPKECIPLPTSDLEADAGGRKKKGRRVLQKRKEGEFRRIPAVGVFGCILLLPPPQLLCEERLKKKEEEWRSLLSFNVLEAENILFKNCCCVILRKKSSRR